MHEKIELNISIRKKIIYLQAIFTGQVYHILYGINELRLIEKKERKN